MLTREQHVAIYRVLADEETKARKAVAKAHAAYDTAPAAYGGSVERETAAVLINLRADQYMAAQRAAADYFNAYIANAA